jgi:hypothetical protein
MKKGPKVSCVGDLAEARREDDRGREEDKEEEEHLFSKPLLSGVPGPPVQVPPGRDHGTREGWPLDRAELRGKARGKWDLIWGTTRS